MAKSFGMPMPGRPMTANTPPPPAPPPMEEEAGETYEITPDELAELNASGTVTCGDGKVITVTGETEEEEAPVAPDEDQASLMA